jgi:glycosyltransferase involved in cell wall biosynthesis
VKPDKIKAGSKKILHVSASYKPAFVYGGPTMSVSTLCENLAKAGEAIEVATTTANGKEDFSYSNGDKVVVDGVPVVYFKRLTGDHSHFSPSLYSYLFRHLKDYSVIHIHAWWNLVTIGAAFVCWLKGKQYVLSPRGTLGQYSFSNRSGFLKKLFHIVLGKRLLRKALFLVTSRKEADDITRILPNGTTYVIPNFIQLSSDRSVARQDSDKNLLRLLFFSRIEQKKGLEFLLQALSKISCPYTLNIYGEGESEYLESLKLLVPNSEKCNVIWNSAVYGNAKYKILESHDLLVLPSYDENFANVVIESLSVGTPVLVTKNVGLSDYVEENRFGWICDQDFNEIAEAINFISKEKAELDRIRIEAPAKIKSDFEVKSLTKKYSAFYSSV